MDLKDKNCTPCNTTIPPLKQEEKLRLLKLLDHQWRLTFQDKRIERNFGFKNFKDALQFTNEVGRISEEQKHHPEIHLGWGHCRLEIWTHSNNDLHENDFILAAKITEIYREIFEKSPF
jgi:4a-hydroxytetrahydrobiopterin dehydratase